MTLDPEVLELFPKDKNERELIRAYRRLVNRVRSSGKEGMIVVDVRRMGRGVSSGIFDASHQGTTVSDRPGRGRA